MPFVELRRCLHENGCSIFVSSAPRGPAYPDRDGAHSGGETDVPDHRGGQGSRRRTAPPGVQAGIAGRIGSPELCGCDDIAWTDFPECPAGVPALLRGLLDPVAAREAERVLCIVLMDSPFSMGPAMPTALPFLICLAADPAVRLRLAADPAVPVRAELVEVLLVVAELSHPVDGRQRAGDPVPGQRPRRPGTRTLPGRLRRARRPGARSARRPDTAGRAHPARRAAKSSDGGDAVGA
ncbi:hypothetical protein SAMN06272771_5863 [Streptomyces sp. Ag82_O1-12]|nr:hypothetical protein SAMN06272771_5863 [Streptomyces sp. Ag82_O1-12]SOD48424.1 hypothetical protein SAMN06272727_5866 [Streptomyces sp. Ag82_G6-1]